MSDAILQFEPIFCISFIGVCRQGFSFVFPPLSKGIFPPILLKKCRFLSRRVLNVLRDVPRTLQDLFDDTTHSKGSIPMTDSSPTGSW